MQRFVALGVFSLVLTVQAVSAVRAADAEAEALRKKALDWLKANNVEKRDNSQIVTKLEKPIDEFVKGRHNFTIILGPRLTKDNKPYMVCGWAGDFFPFALTDAQARAIGLKPLGLRANANRRYGKPAGAPAARLSDLKVPGANSLDGGHPIKGTVKLTMLHEVKPDDLYLRLDLKFPESTDVRFIKARSLPAKSATVGFSFKAINPPGGKDKPARGPVAAFLNLVVMPDGDKSRITVLSNTLGILLDVE